MVALTTCALVLSMRALAETAPFDWPRFLVMVAASGVATLFVLSLLHSDLRRLYNKLADSARLAEREARTDPLTQGQNRKAFLERLSDLLADTTPRGDDCLVFVDLDHFKRVNDTLGHEAGDEVLREAFSRMSKVVGHGALYRLSGDEFALILENTVPGIALGRCHEIRKVIGRPFAIGERACSIDCSLGLVSLDRAATASPSDAMRRADLAMYRAKQRRSGVEEFDADLLRLVMRKTGLADRLRAALARGEGLNTLFQAIIQRDRQPFALEALFRWFDEELGEISPVEAISIAKEFRILDPLSLYVVRSACRAATAIPGLRISINLEASQLFDTRFICDLEAILVEEDVANERFILEIGEGDIADNCERIEPVLLALGDAGFTLAVDNFGSSTASLTHLAKLGVSHVKLDRSLLHSARETGSIAVIKAKVQLAKSLGMLVTCEAVGDEEDEQIALQSDCDFLQGYRYCVPQGLDALATSLADQSLGSHGGEVRAPRPSVENRSSA